VSHVAVSTDVVEVTVSKDLPADFVLVFFEIGNVGSNVVDARVVRTWK